MALLKRDFQGHLIIFKKMLIRLVGVFTYARFNLYNKIKIEGTEHLEGLPLKNVLFVSNHQTYFADVIALVHVFCSVKWGFKNSIRNPLYLLNPRSDVSFVAAAETMKDGILPKIFAYAGSVSIHRTWREAGKSVNRQVKMSDIRKIKDALNQGWVITFPQGTTNDFAPGRRGTAHIVKSIKPVIVPVVIDGFRKAFDKKGLRMKKTGTALTIRFKPPMELDFKQDSDVILEKLMDAIEQSEKYKNQGLKKKEVVPKKSVRELLVSENLPLNN